MTMRSRAASPDARHSIASKFLDTNYERMKAMYERQLLRSALSYEEAVETCNVADMSAFYVEQKAYTDIIRHTRDLLTGGDGYQCWLSDVKGQQQHSFSHSISTRSCCSPLAAVQDAYRHGADSPQNPVTGHGHAAAAVLPVPAQQLSVCPQEDSRRTPAACAHPEIEELPDLEYEPGAPTGAEYLVCSAAASAARQNILNQVKLRQQLLNAQRRRMLINPQAIHKVAKRYKDKITWPFRRLAASMGYLTLAQKRTYADNYSTSQWTREPSHCGRRGLLGVRKRDILNPWDKKPTTKTPAEDAYSRKAPCAPQIAPSTLQRATADAATEARSGSLAAAQLRAAAAEQYAGQTVARGRGRVHQLLFRCSTVLGVAAAKAGLLKPQMQNTVAVPAKLGASAYLNPSRTADVDAVETGNWNGPRSEASCLRMDQLRLLCQLEQLTKQHKRLKAQLALAKLACFLSRATAQSGTPSSTAGLEQQLHMTASSIHCTKHTLSQLQDNIKRTANLSATLDQCISVANPPEDLWEDYCADLSEAEASLDGHVVVQLALSQQKASEIQPCSPAQLQGCTEIQVERCTGTTAMVPAKLAASELTGVKLEGTDNGLGLSKGGQLLATWYKRLMSNKRCESQVSRLGSSKDDVVKRYSRRRC